jgi:hypothetical protein
LAFVAFAESTLVVDDGWPRQNENRRPPACAAGLSIAWSTG